MLTMLSADMKARVGLSIERSIPTVLTPRFSSRHPARGLGRGPLALAVRVDTAASAPFLLPTVWSKMFCKA